MPSQITIAGGRDVKGISAAASAGRRESAATPLVLAAGVAWLACVAAGMGILVRYSLAPGRSGTPPAVWPAASRLDRLPHGYTLVLAAHPHCPCTRASLAELAVIMTRCRGRVATQVLFVQPDGFSNAWVKTDLWRTVEAMPGATPVLDPRGREARRFEAFTSGQAALYDPDGRLAFSGGITGARGHEGPNAGLSAVLARVERGTGGEIQTPVYGCPLEKPSSRLGKETQACPPSQ